MFTILICGLHRPVFELIFGGFGKVGSFKCKTIRKDFLR
jgi:hypothetical protein